MSVPPLVCSTPPPPDQIDDDEYNDDFSFNNYEDSSSPHPYEGREFSSFESSAVKDIPIKYSESKTTVEEIATSEKTNSNPPDINNHKSNDISADKNISKSERTDVSKDIEETSECLEHNVISNHSTEESNIEDLDLRLESLHLDFDNERVSVEDSLNSTFDDFGTFLTTSELNESLYLPKESDTDNNYVSEKDTKSQETCSEDSVSLRNDDSSDFEVGWDNFNQPLGQTNNLPDGTIPTTSSCEETDGSNTETACKVTDSNICQQITLTDNVHDLCLEDISISDADLNSVEASELDFKSTDSSGIFVESKPIDIVDEHNTNDDIDGQDEDSNISISLSPAEDRHTPSPLAHHKELKEGAETSELTDSNDNIKDATNNVILNNCTDQNIPDSAKLEEINSFDSSIDEFDDFATFQDAEPVEILKEVVENVFSNSNPDLEFEANFTTFPCEENSLEPYQEADTIIVADNLKSSSCLVTAEDDDDFGDFDTYDPTSSAIDETTFISNAGSKQTDSPKITDLIHSNDTEIIEILNKAVGTIYPSDGVTENEDNAAESHELKTVLGENWKHLRDYEAEQSYLFAWNNSASQKSLLKSLGIDSRNILFGPKWNTNMPRFAANLGVSPLLPVKQTISTNSSGDSRTDEKSPSGAEIINTTTTQNINDWESTENFSMGDNQASSYAESLLLDLEHLMATLDQMTSGQSTHFKISDLFTNACNERGEELIGKPQIHQDPLSESTSKDAPHPAPPSILNIGRKINLPDTHIFTPTDSETPWSHTIHYDDGNTDTLHSNMKTNEYTDSFAIAASNADDKPNDITTGDDFDDFQSHANFDFVTSKTSGDKKYGEEETTEVASDSEAIESNSSDLQKSNLDKFDDFGDFHSATIEEQIPRRSTILPPVGVLEPVRLSSMIPVVNWPSPGEISNSSFGDFSDTNNHSQETPISRPSEMPHANKLPQASGPVSFILKESKIDAETCAMDNSQPVAKTSDKGASDDFSDFQSVSRIPFTNHSKIPSTFRDTLITTHTVSENVAESVFSNNTNPLNDDFDDFQSVEFNPVYTNYQEKHKVNHYYSQPAPAQYQEHSMPGFTPNPHMPEYTFSANNIAKPTLDPTPIQAQRVEDTSSKNATQQILQPLFLENYSQINWPDPGIDLQDLSRFNPINSIQSYSEPKTTPKNTNSHSNVEDDGWSDFVSIKPNNPPPNPYFPPPLNTYTQNPNTYGQNSSTFVSSQPADDTEDWSDFVSGAVVPSRNLNEVKTISQNIHSHSQSGNMNSPYYKNPGQAAAPSAFKGQQSPVTAKPAPPLSVLPHLTYISPKANVSRFNNSHFQNL